MSRRRGRSRRKGDPIASVHPDPLGLGAFARRFLEWLLIKNYSAATVKERGRHLGVFIAWCEERGLFLPDEVTRELLERYGRFLYHCRRENGEPLKARSRHGRLVSVRIFFGWMAKKGHLAYNPAFDLDLPKLEYGLPKAILTVEEAERVLAQPDVEDPLGLRDRAMLETIYSTGIRRQEVAGLRIQDLDLDRGTLTVRLGKGKKDRVVPIGERALAWIEKYRIEVRPSLMREPDEGFLFLNMDHDPIAADYVTHLVRAYVARSGVARPGACHLFRHTCATLMLEGGADIRYIQQMLGHVSLKTTQIYTQVSIRKLKEVHDATHPGAKLAAGPSSAAPSEERERHPEPPLNYEAALP